MAGVTITAELDARVLAEIDRVFARLGSEGVREIADAVGGMMADQTQRRIKTEKAAPDGTPWAPWSDRYASTRNTGNTRQNSLLIDSEQLLNSIQQYTTGDTVTVGAGMIYSAIHQFGGRGIPERPYLGLSAADRREIEDLVIDLSAEWLQ
jgi:phage virion morphogenesis protein